MKSVHVLLAGVIVVGMMAFPTLQENEYRRRCPHLCPMYIITFCGSDGHTYRSNPCVVKTRMCQEDIPAYRHFTMRHLGPCTDTEQATP